MTPISSIFYEFCVLPMETLPKGHSDKCTCSQQLHTKLKKHSAKLSPYYIKGGNKLQYTMNQKYNTMYINICIIEIEPTIFSVKKINSLNLISISKLPLGN